MSKINPLLDFIPRVPKLAEYSTGLSMGEHAEIMAQKNAISRREQDEYAYFSHVKAAAALDEGRLKEEIIACPLPHGSAIIDTDNGIRRDTTVAKLATLALVFDKQKGSITAGNACPITDGGSAALVMSAEKAASLGYQPKAYIRAYAYTALDPEEQLLLGPAYAIPEVLDRAKLSLQDIDIIEMHEAFAAQVLSVIQKLESQKFAHEQLGRSKAVGKIDRDILNINGGSLALGHPFGATGVRLVTAAINELQRRDVSLALVATCTAGGLGAALILERV